MWITHEKYEFHYEYLQLNSLKLVFFVNIITLKTNFSKVSSVTVHAMLFPNTLKQYNLKLTKLRYVVLTKEKKMSELNNIFSHLKILSKLNQHLIALKCLFFKNAFLILYLSTKNVARFVILI